MPAHPYHDCPECGGDCKVNGPQGNRIDCPVCRGHGVSLRNIADLLMEIRDELKELDRNMPRTPTHDDYCRR